MHDPDWESPIGRLPAPEKRVLPPPPIPRWDGGKAIASMRRCRSAARVLQHATAVEQRDVLGYEDAGPCALPWRTTDRQHQGKSLREGIVGREHEYIELRSTFSFRSTFPRPRIPFEFVVTLPILHNTGIGLQRPSRPKLRSERAACTDFFLVTHLRHHVIVY